jgi:hypothetical protein
MVTPDELALKGAGRLPVRAVLARHHFHSQLVGVAAAEGKSLADVAFLILRN